VIDGGSGCGCKNKIKAPKTLSERISLERALSRRNQPIFENWKKLTICTNLTPPKHGQQRFVRLSVAWKLFFFATFSEANILTVERMRARCGYVVAILQNEYFWFSRFGVF
jgi:hypothetical protein